MNLTINDREAVKPAFSVMEGNYENTKAIRIRY